MSTTPGEHTWADAGLVPPDSSEVPRSERRTTPEDPAGRPAAPRPDLHAEAAEHDLDEQSRDLEGVPATEAVEPTELPDDAPEGDALEQRQDPTGYVAADAPPRLPEDAPEGDALEQAIEVPDDDADDYPSA